MVSEDAETKSVELQFRTDIFKNPEKITSRDRKRFLTLVHLMFLGEVEENFTIYVDVYTVCIELGPRVLGHSEPRLGQYCSKILTDLKTTCFLLFSA